MPKNVTRLEASQAPLGGPRRGVVVADGTYTEEQTNSFYENPYDENEREFMDPRLDRASRSRVNLAERELSVGGGIYRKMSDTAFAIVT